MDEYLDDMNLLNVLERHLIRLHHGGRVSMCSCGWAS